MSERQDDGSTLREHLEQVQKITGRPQPELQDAPELPEASYYVWNWFVKLNSKRGSNGFGMNPLTYTEMYSFFKLQGIFPEQWELDLLEELDSVALKQSYEEQKKSEKKNSSKNK